MNNAALCCYCAYASQMAGADALCGFHAHHQTGIKPEDVPLAYALGFGLPPPDPLGQIAIDRGVHDDRLGPKEPKT